MSDNEMDLWTAEELGALAEELRQCEPEWRWLARQRMYDFFNLDDDSVWIRARTTDAVLISAWGSRELRERTPGLIKAIVEAFRMQMEIERELKGERQ